MRKVVIALKQLDMAGSPQTMTRVVYGAVATVDTLLRTGEAVTVA